METQERFEELEQKIEDLKQALTREVRTRRLVVVDEDGFERVIGMARGTFGQISVRGRSLGGRTTAAELFANDPIDTDTANVGIGLSDRGNVVASFDVFERQPARLWFDGDGDDDVFQGLADVPEAPDAGEVG